MGESYDYLFKILIIGNQESNKHKVLDKFLDETTAGRSPRGNRTGGTNTAAGSSQGKHPVQHTCNDFMLYMTRSGL